MKSERYEYRTFLKAPGDLFRVQGAPSVSLNRDGGASEGAKCYS